MRSAKVGIRRAVNILLHDGVVALPTETVYGLAAAYNSPVAVQSVFCLKQRPQNNPLIVHLAERSYLLWLLRLTRCSASEMALLEQAAIAFWPGPLTLILPASANVPGSIRAHQPTVALRVPHNELMQKVLHEVAIPLVAPSANVSGRPSSTTAEHVLEDFPRGVSVLDGGACSGGLESTVLYIGSTECHVLRPGPITTEQLQSVLSVSVSGFSAEHSGASPGTRYKHYAPKASVILVTQLEEVRLHATGSTVVLTNDNESLAGFVCRPLHARTLYAEFRRADQLGVREIIVHCSADVQAEEALMDRLTRAAATTFSTA
jgi:L-threonylcarbamoyladenylate synthase